MRIILAALIAAFLALPLAAADRPVGPEAGQSRTGKEAALDFAGDPDDDAWHGYGYGGPPRGELGLSWWERIMREAECRFRTWC